MNLTLTYAFKQDICSARLGNLLFLLLEKRRHLIAFKGYHITTGYLRWLNIGT